MPHVSLYCAAIAMSSLSLLAIRPPQARPPRVLVAEDDPVSQRVAALMLQSFGCEVELAPNGLTALHKLDTAEYDLVFLDCRMPLMDGYDVAREIRRREAEQARERRTLIAITADAQPVNREACMAAGMDDCVTRPLLVAELRRVVMRFGATPA